MTNSLKHEPTILLVHGDENESASILQVLKKNGFHHKLIAVKTSIEALEYVFGTGSYSGRDVKILPSLIIVEGGKDGEAEGLIRILRGYLRIQDVPVIALGQRDREKEQLEGVNNYLKKPFNFREFSDALAQLGLKSVFNL
ncbi:MAG: hypothetical protein KCHDKBKB_01577 [Elusimicrobia bacterium]|nr:hypothetical protein [Elusimicrobiota bacterium]